MAYFGNSDFTGLDADDFNHKKKDKSSSSTDVSGNKRKGTAVERARVRLQESGDKTTKLFHTMGDMVSSDIRFAGFKRGKTDDDVKVHCERTNGSDDVKVHFGEPVDAVTVRDGQQEGCPPTRDGRRREDVPTVLNYSRLSTADLDEVREDSKAVKVLRAAKFAKSARSSYRARLKWWEDRCKIRGWNPREVTPFKLEVAAALLKKGKYRSASLYLSSIKRQYVEAGGRVHRPTRSRACETSRHRCRWRLSQQNPHHLLSKSTGPQSASTSS